MMTGREAEQTLEVIRTLMERSTRYTNLSGHAGIAAGLATLVGSALRAGLDTPFVATWFGVLAAATGLSAFFTARMAWESGEPLWTRQAKTVVLALLPALVATIVLSLVMIRAELQSLLPGVWMLLWGVGALAMSFFTPRSLSVLGASFMVAGTITLAINPSREFDAWTMGLTFGAIHLAYGLGLMLLRSGDRREVTDSGRMDRSEHPGTKAVTYDV